MSERVKQKIGEELYKKILDAGIKPEEFDMLEGYIPRSRFNEATGKASAMQSKIESYEKQIKDTQLMLDNHSELKGQYSELQNKYQADLEAKDREISNVLKSSLVKESLTKEGARHVDLLMKNIDLEKLSLDNGNLIGISDTMTKLKTDYADLFEEKKTSSNGGTGGKGDDGGAGEKNIFNSFL